MVTNKREDSLLVKKYNQPIPRYTSYPTVPVWKETIDVVDWEERVQQQFNLENELNGISLYIHLPFCESMCTYCGCNKKITKNHKVETEYIAAIEKEWKHYRTLMNGKPIIRELHLGGGTPTFFSPSNLDRLLNIILDDCIIHPLNEFSIEGHPNNTTIEHLKILFSNGFTRISYGVQDNDPEVQRVINRIQPIENVRTATEQARIIGFSSVNFDLIYGLPLQTLESIERTINQVTELMPDRIAFYSYAHVPCTSRGQRLFDENDLPTAEEKIAFYIKGSQMLTEKGYHDIGMDHFALPTDELYKAKEEGKLHRNFMGYTSHHSGMLIGLGVSAISDVNTGYAQNEKSIHDYYSRLNNQELPIKKGYFLSAEDLLFKKNILDISCNRITHFLPEQMPDLEAYSFAVLDQLVNDGLVLYNKKRCKLTRQGQYFIRNVCSSFDLHMQRNKLNQKRQLFSSAI